MDRPEPGSLMVSITNPNVILEVLSVAPDGGVRVRMDYAEATTTLRYLKQNYRFAGDAV